MSKPEQKQKMHSLDTKERVFVFNYLKFEQKCLINLLGFTFMQKGDDILYGIKS